MRHLRQHRIEQTVGTLAPQPRLDGRRRTVRTLYFEKQIDVEPVSAIGGNAAGRCMRLLDEPFFFEPCEDATDRRGRPTGPWRADEPARGHGPPPRRQL